jgi:MFS family permease
MTHPSVWMPPSVSGGGDPPETLHAAKHSVLAIGCLIAAVGLAFADASVVALALPDLYAEFDTTIVGVSWVLTTYAVAVAVVAVPIALLHRRVRPLSLVLAGTVTFTAASGVAGSATSLSMLLAARAVQGAGAALLLAGSLPVLAAIVPGEGRARRWWALAGAVGVAIGPALGGVLTQLFDWRAIFFVQAPIVAAALVVVADPAARALRREGHVHGRAGTRRRDVIIANVGFALVFAALVAALFLGVLLAIEVWRYSPIESALLVSALPLGMAIGRRFQAAPGIDVALGGALLLALGLGALAMMPGARPVMAAIAFALCGAGFDLLHEVLDGAAVPADGPAVQASAVSIGARHAGLVLGLALIAPVLSSSLDHGIDRATLGATRTMLTTDLDLSDKLPVTWALRTAIEDAPRGQVPDLAQQFDERGAEDGNSMARARDALMDNVTDAITRSFRPAFGLAAGLAALSGIPALLVVGRTRRGERAWSDRRRRTSTVGIAALSVAAIGLLGWQVGAGARTVGEFVAEDPCTAGPDPYPGDGLDASLQRIALSTLNGAACELHTTRERLVLSLDESSGYHDVTWDKPTLERALKVGAHRAIDDANDRDAIPGFVAAALGFLVDKAPIGWLVNRIPIGG